MRFDEPYFDRFVSRHGTGSMKWDEEGDDADVIQLWVADMDFPTAPAIIDALRARVDSGIFGYTHVGREYYDALVSWFERRHGWVIDPSRVIYTSGVVPAVSAIIKALAPAGSGVIIPTPAYNCFFSSVRNNGCRQVLAPLRRIDRRDGFTYEMDFEELERAAEDPSVSLMILCNPHNPTGRIWTRQELERVSEITRRHGVTVISDEIHCELIHDGMPGYVPYAIVDPSAVICCAPTKAFNIAGLQIANIICPDPDTQRRIDRAINDNEVCDVNPFGVIALREAYNNGEEWLDALNTYLTGNFTLLRESFAETMPNLPVALSESTYLAWVDITSLGITSEEVADMLLKEARVRVSSGSTYADDRYIRINYALPRPRLSEALKRMSSAINSL